MKSGGTDVNATIRTPLEVIALVFDEDKLPLEVAKQVEQRLIAALNCAPGTLITESNGTLVWAHYIRVDGGRR